MKEVRESESISPELMRMLDVNRVDSNKLVGGEYSPARVNIPRVKDIVDDDVKVASTNEDTEDESIEVKSGTAESDEEAGWYEVTFEEPFDSRIDRPIVNATATQRSGDFANAQFEPPNIELDTIELIGLDTVEFMDVELEPISLSAPKIGERSIDHESKIPELDFDIDVPGISSDIDISEPDIDVGSGISGVDIGDIDIEPPNLEHASVEGTFSFEDRFTNSSRRVGEFLYETGADAFDQYLPSPGGVNLTGPFKDTWDFMTTECYGHGRSSKSGDGLAESVYRELGQFLDEEIADAFGEKALEQEELASKVEEQIISHNNRIVDEFLSFEEELRDEVTNFADNAIADIENLQADADEGLSIVTEELQYNNEEMAANIEDAMTDFADSVIVALEDFGVEVQDMGDNMDISIEDLNAEIEDLSADVDEELEILGDDTQTGFDTIAEDISDMGEEFREDTQEKVNDAISSIESEVNDRMDEINELIPDIEEKMNGAFSELAALSETAINDSLELLYETMGMPKGELMVPVQTRNVTNEGFEFLGYEGGTEIDWTAMSRTGGDISVGDSDKIIDDVIDELIDRGIIDGD